MGLKEKANRFLDRYHTKKRWPYLVLFIIWFLFILSISINMALAAIGTGELGQRLGVIGGCNAAVHGCVLEVMGPLAVCTGGTCTSDGVVTVLLDTNGDRISDETAIINATEYYCSSYYHWCSQDGVTIMKLVAFNLVISSIFLLGITVVVWSLLIIKFIVGIRDWRRARKS